MAAKNIGNTEGFVVVDGTMPVQHSNTEKAMNVESWRPSGLMTMIGRGIRSAVDAVDGAINFILGMYNIIIIIIMPHSYNTIYYVAPCTCA